MMGKAYMGRGHSPKAGLNKAHHRPLIGRIPQPT